MLSALRKGLIYKNISSDIIEHDLDIDADQWSYEGRDVYRGSFDPQYTALKLNVYWLYDDDLKRIGLAEHESDEPEIFKALWFHSNPFSTLTQDSSWAPSGSLWSLMSNEAYQDCLEDDFKTVHLRSLKSRVILVTPEIYINYSDIETDAGKQKFLLDVGISQPPTVFSCIFVDEDFIVFKRQQPDACDQVQKESESQHPDPLELKDEPLHHLPPQESDP